ncbi:YpdA family putative bacillithiol disulfide reductase [Mesohalobacter halotolerans]|uniref:YpdA family putative bacillithiol disulfide reductase n=1 Tax=Mesohalobacter halotolerans TaxID=1883405 RepID=A0A4U5TP10_9FLAO|nr:YpdA family putative bacillithiol disulfide reductase [Mesohalobacter halotolerans]MBS3738038.1 YpdA family putative bacillithiol disulfide reductase [Psychroflexus sp.]TKS55790.1 YpdA family putative bacillithiol disulfide reductase [Mesohalobacter halotolerans]
MTYDIVIIGGGPIGLACGLEAKKRNLSYVIIEKGALVNSLYHYPANMTFFSTSEKLEIDGIPFISKNPKPTKQEALEYYRRVATSNDLNINLFEAVENVDKLKNNFRVKTSKQKYDAKNIIIATGFYDIPNKLNVPGEDSDKVFHYYNDPHYFVNQDVIVVGASNSAVDAALEIYRKGGRVTMIVRGKEIGQRVKYWVRPDIINRIEEGSIKAYFNSEITKIKKDTVDFKDENGKIQQLKNDYVLALTGYKPNFGFLKKLGIKLSNDKTKLPEYNKQTMETNVKGLYLAGVICGGMETHKWFIENSRIHAKMIVEDIC